MIVDNAERRRFELTEKGECVFASYRRDEASFDIYHVEAAPILRGTGAASRLMEGIAALAREHGFKIVPTCSYACAWFKRHPQAGDVLGN